MAHISSTHITVSVDVHKLNPHYTQFLSCDECEYTCTLNRQMKSHVKRKHVQECKYKCNFCDFEANVIISMYKHKFEAHPEIDHEFRPQTISRTSHDFILNLLAEQNIALMEEMLNLKSDLKDFKKEVVNSVVEIKEQTKACLSENKKNKKNEENTEILKANVEGKKHKITWIGTSLSKVLDKKKVEEDLGVELKAVKAYCVKEEGRFPNENFKTIVPEAIKDGNIDTLVLEAGNIEISNVEVNNAMMNTDKDIEESKKEWFEEAEETSKSLFNLAEKSIASDPNLNVVIVKRPQRFDKSSKDILGIKAKVSEYANQVYDQCKLKSSNSQRIHLVDLKLGADKSNHLKHIIYGAQDDPRYDGIHLSGSGASRHFTYRAVQALKQIVPYSSQKKMSSSPIYKKRSARGDSMLQSDHTTCPQALYQREKQRGNRTNQARHYVSYASAVRNNGQTRVGQTVNFAIPTKNRFDLLSRNSQGNC